MTFFSKKYGVILTGLCAGLILLAINAGDIYRFLRYVDKYYFHEFIKDHKARLISSEDWSDVPPPAVGGYDYQWRDYTDLPGFKGFAHALGGKGVQANSFSAYEQSARRGFVFFEVDLWLDNDGVIRCHHGPESPPQLSAESCTFSRLLKRLGPDHYLILDIKTGFLATAEKILAAARRHDKAGNMIFQLYAPGHIVKFASWTAQYDLPGPIVTAYKSERALNHIYRAVDKAGIRAFTFPLPRMAALIADRDYIYLFTHPVRNCIEKQTVISAGIKGGYVKNDLNCGEKDDFHEIQ